MDMNDLSEFMMTDGTGIKAQESKSKLHRISFKKPAQVRPLMALAKLGLNSFTFSRKVHTLYSPGNRELGGTFACPEDAGAPEGTCPACNRYRDSFSTHIKDTIAAHDGDIKAARKNPEFKEFMESAKPFDAWFEHLAPSIDRTNHKFGWVKFSKTLREGVVAQMQGLLTAHPDHAANIAERSQDAKKLEAYLFNVLLNPVKGFDMTLSHPPGNNTAWNIVINTALPTPMLDPANEALNVQVIAFMKAVQAIPEDERSKYLYKVDMWKPEWMNKQVDVWWRNTGMATTQVQVPAQGEDVAAGVAPASGGIDFAAALVKKNAAQETAVSAVDATLTVAEKPTAAHQPVAQPEAFNTSAPAAGDGAFDF